MTEYDFMLLLASMREHQKKYFIARTDEELFLAKDAERKVDDYIQKYFNPTLF